MDLLDFARMLDIAMNKKWGFDKFDTKVLAFIKSYDPTDKTDTLSLYARGGSVSNNIVTLSDYAADNRIDCTIDVNNLPFGDYELSWDFSRTSGTYRIVYTVDGNNTDIATGLAGNYTFPFTIDSTDSRSIHLYTDDTYLRGTFTFTLKQVVKDIETQIADYLATHNITSGVDIIVNKTDQQVTYNGLTDTQVIDLVQSKASNIANAALTIKHPSINQVVNTLTYFNETAPITNNTIWNTPYDTPNPSTSNFYSRHFTPFKNGYLGRGYQGIALYAVSNGEVVFVENVDTSTNIDGATITWDGKRIFSIINNSVYMYNRLDDGTWEKQYTGIQEDDAYNNIMVKWDGLEFMCRTGIYSVANDGTWTKTGEYTTLNMQFAWITPDYKFMYAANLYSATLEVRFAEKQDDGTWVQLPSLMLDTDNYNYLRAVNVSIDKQKAVCKLRRKADAKWVLQTFYRQDDNSWSLVSENTTTDTYGLNSGTGGLLMTLDGETVYAVRGNSGDPLATFIAKVLQDLLVNSDLTNNGSTVTAWTLSSKVSIYDNTKLQFTYGDSGATPFITQTITLTPGKYVAEIKYNIVDINTPIPTWRINCYDSNDNDVTNLPVTYETDVNERVGFNISADTAYVTISTIGANTDVLIDKVVLNVDTSDLFDDLEDNNADSRWDAPVNTIFDKGRVTLDPDSQYSLVDITRGVNLPAGTYNVEIRGTKLEDSGSSNNPVFYLLSTDTDGNEVVEANGTFISNTNLTLTAANDITNIRIRAINDKVQVSDIMITAV